MRTRNLLYIATAFAVIACAKDITTESTNDVQQEVRLVPMTFTAGADDASDTESKVALGGKNFKSVLWSESDQIKVFDGKNANLPAFELVSGNGETSGVFSGQVSEDLQEGIVFYALYPYQENAVFNESITVGNTTYENAITATVPSEQIAVPNSVPSNAFLAAAFSDAEGNFKFQNILGLIKFQLSEEDVQDLVSVSISGNNYDYIAGDICISFDATTKVVKNDYIRGNTSSYVTLKPEEGKSFQANTSYYFAIRPSSFNPSSGTKGFTLTAKYSDGSCRHISTNSAPSQNVARNTVLNLETIPFRSGLPNDLYIAYLHGHNINAGDIIINKETYSDASIIKENNKTVSGTSTVSFIKPGLTGVKVSQNGVNKFIIVGSDAKTRSSVTIEKQIQPTSIDGSVNTVILKNLDATYNTTSQLFSLKSNFSTICIDNCSIKDLNHTLINAVDGTNKLYYQCDKISISNSELQLTNRDAIYLYFSQYTENDSSTDLTVKNNIVYFTPNTTYEKMTDFKLLSGKPVVKSILVENNTFDKTVIPNAGLIQAKNITESLLFNKNLFSDSAVTSANTNILVLSESSSATGKAENNYYYNSYTYEKTFSFTNSGSKCASITPKANPTSTGSAFLPSDWDPSKGVFNTNYILPEGVSGVGATR